MPIASLVSRYSFIRLGFMTVRGAQIYFPNRWHVHLADVDTIIVGLRKQIAIGLEPMAEAMTQFCLMKAGIFLPVSPLFHREKC